MKNSAFDASYWAQPADDFDADYWAQPAEPVKKRKPFPGEGFALGLGQWAADTLQNTASHGAEPEVDIPDFLKPEKLRNKPETNRESLVNLEQFAPEDQRLQFKVGQYGPDVAALGYGLARGAAKLGSKAIGKEIVKDVKEMKGSFKNEYNSIFDEAEKKGVSAINSKANKADLQRILNEVDSKYYSGIQNFIDNPTARNAHLAQSDLGKFIRKMESKRELVSAEHEALKTARKTQEILKNEVYSNLLKQGGLDLPFKYLDVTKRYAGEMVPFLENSPVRKALLKPGQKGYIKPERLPQKLKLESSDPLMEHLRGKIEGTKNPVNPALYGKYPLLGANQALASPAIKYGVIGTGAGYGGYELLKALLGKG